MARKINFDHNPILYVCEWVADLFLINTLWVICSLPVFTIGASTTAAHCVILKKLRGEKSVSVISTFFQSFRRNFKQATVLWIFYLFTAVDVWMLLYSYGEGTVNLAVISSSLPVAFGVVVFTVIWLFTFLYAFPMLALLDLSLKQCFCNSLLLSFRHFGNTLVILITGTALLILLEQFYWFAILVIGVILYIQSALVYKTFLPFLPKEQE